MVLQRRQLIIGCSQWPGNAIAFPFRRTGYFGGFEDFVFVFTGFYLGVYVFERIAQVVAESDQIGFGARYFVSIAGMAEYEYGFLL